MEDWVIFLPLILKKTFIGLNIIQIESDMNYVNYNGLLKFEVFSRKKGYRDLINTHKEKKLP